MPAVRSGSNRGVTLLELMVAMALTGLVAALAVAFWKDAGNAARLTKGRREAGMIAQAFFSSLSENLLAGKGVISIGPRELVLINGAKHRMEYKWEDSTLTINGKAVGLRVADFEVAPMGPERPVKEGASRSTFEFWDLDSLDDDRDGRVDFKELDRDRSGDLNVDECRFVAEYRISLTIVDRNLSMTQTGLVHPRNHASAQLLGEVGRALVADGNAEF